MRGRDWSISSQEACPVIQRPPLPAPRTLEAEHGEGVSDGHGGGGHQQEGA